MFWWEIVICEKSKKENNGKYGRDLEGDKIAATGTNWREA
jgi:hypothetical protein